MLLSGPHPQPPSFQGGKGGRGEPQPHPPSTGPSTSATPTPASSCHHPATKGRCPERAQLKKTFQFFTNPITAPLPPVRLQTTPLTWPPAFSINRLRPSTSCCASTEASLSSRSASWVQRPSVGAKEQVFFQASFRRFLASLLQVGKNRFVLPGARAGTAAAALQPLVLRAEP